MTGQALHICLVIRLLNDKGGGAERLYCELANLLSRRGFDVTCAFYDSSSGSPFYQIDDAVKIANLAPMRTGRPGRYERIKHMAKRIYRALTRRGLTRPFQKLNWQLVHGDFVRRLTSHFQATKPDVVISFLPSANTPTLIAAKVAGVPAIPSNHNAPEFDYEAHDRWDPNPIDRELRLRLLDDAAAVHVLFDDFKKWFPARLQSKLVAIPNYVSSEFKASDDVPRENVVLAVGRLAATKNYLDLIRAWSLIASDFPDWRVWIIGDGPQRKRLADAARASGVMDKVNFLGAKKNLGCYYRGASLFCHPSTHEGFGLSAAEALAHGVPVIAYSDCTGINQFVSDANGVLVDRESGATGLAAALRLLIENNSLRNQLSEAAPGSVSDFTEEIYLSKWLAVIDDVTSRHQ